MRRGDGKMGFFAVASIGVGGMVGGGIFAVLGLAVLLAHGGTPIAFLVAGGVALLTSYSYARLSVSFPSQGGTVIFLDKAFGVDLFTGVMNALLWVSYIIMLALYAFAFGSYGATFIPWGNPVLVKHLVISAGIVLPTLVNMLNAEAVGKAETYIVAIKVVILTFFVIVGMQGVDIHRLAPATWAPPVHLVAGGMIIFLAYEGFELIANTARDVRSPNKTLPRAFYGSVLFVIALYILVAIVATGSLGVSEIVAAKDYALAEAARPVLGSFGFRLIAVAAVLSTFSAINATLYGSARLTYTIAKEGELPEVFEKKVWKNPEGLFITALLALAIANLADLSSISLMGSGGFLLVFAAVNTACFYTAKQTGSRRWIAAAGVVACVAALAALCWQVLATDPMQLLVLGGLIGFALLVELVYGVIRKRGLRLSPPRD